MIDAVFYPSRLLGLPDWCVVLVVVGLLTYR